MPTHRPHRLAPFCGLLALVAVLLGSLAVPALAHTGNQTYLYLDVTEEALSGRVEAPIADLQTALGLADGEQPTNAATVAYLAEHFGLASSDGVAWPLVFDEPELFYSDAPEGDDNYLVIPFVAEVGGTVPRQLSIRFDPFVDEIPSRSALLLIGNDWQGGVIDNGFESLTTFDSGSREQDIDLGETSWWKNFAASIKLGADHIRTGPDHILFVLVLLLPSVLVFTNGAWQPTTSFGSSLWRVLKIATMFTLAHSITFTLAGLDLLPLPPSKLVEAVIALSIAAAALHNLRPVAANKEWLLAFSFGLFHGMGFASLVEGLDVARSTQLISLLGRNVGIEIGQAFVVLITFPALYLLARTRFYRPFFIGASLVLAAIAIAWMIERLAETSLGVDVITDPVFAWPRVVWVMLAATAAATALYSFDRSAKAS